MIVAMTNDSVTVYNLEEKQYLEILKEPNNNEQLNDNIILSIKKGDYSPMRLYKQLDESVSRLDFYYYDNGSTMTRKNITDIFDIKYYEDKNARKWPSYEYMEFIQSTVTISQKQASLIELDNKLNKCSHINMLFTPDELIDFKRCYDQTVETKALPSDLRGKLYEVPSFSRLIIRKNNRKLTSAQLENNIFIIVTPSGLTERGKVKYFVSEYKLTKKDCDEVNKIFRKYLKENNMKVDSLSEADKYAYFDRAVSEHVQNVRGGLEQLNGGTSISWSGNSKTWNEYKAIFFSTHGYPLENFSSNWLIFSRTILDARTVSDGFIIPLIIENYQHNLVNDHIEKPTIDLENTVVNSVDNQEKSIVEPGYITGNVVEEQDATIESEDDLFSHPVYIILPKNKG